MKHTLAVGSAVDAATVSALCSTAGCSTLTECFGESVMLPAASVATAGEGTFRWAVPLVVSAEWSSLAGAGESTGSSFIALEGPFDWLRKRK